MSWTVQQYLDRTRGFADAVGATGTGGWSDDDVKAYLGAIHLEEWENILDSNPLYRHATRSVTTDSSGRIALSALDDLTPDAQQRLYRILSVSSGPTIYTEAPFLDSPLAASQGLASDARGYRIEGDYLQILEGGAVPSGATMTVVVSHTPTPIDALSVPTSAVEFPRGRELLVCYATAAVMLLKGARETGASRDLEAKAEAVRQRMLATITRPTARPQTWRYGDTAAEWSG